MAEIAEIEEAMEEAAEAGMAEDAAEGAESGISTRKSIAEQEGKSAADKLADLEAYDRAVETGDTSKVPDAFKDKAEKEIAQKNKQFQNIERVLQKIDPDVKLDPTKGPDENFPEGSANAKALKEFNDYAENELPKDKVEKLKEKAGRETDETKRKTWEKVALYMGFLGVAVGGAIAALAALADHDTGCYQFYQGTDTKLDCGSTKIDTLKQNCICPSAPKSLLPMCPLVNSSATCDTGYIYHVVKVSWWNELGMVLGGFKDAAEAVAKDIQQIFDIIIKYWWVIPLVVVLGFMAYFVVGIIRKRKGGGVVNVEMVPIPAPAPAP